ncbi:MAG: hypothetical protein AB4042_19105 [Leptolyngbyaceae cyanobacterium]
MLNAHQMIRLLFLSSLVFCAATACKSPVTDGSGGTTPESTTTTAELSDETSSPSAQPDNNPTDDEGENQETEVPSPDLLSSEASTPEVSTPEAPTPEPPPEATSPEETGLADLEKIVDTIAAEDAIAPDTEPVPQVALALATDGLQVITLQTGSIRTIPFEAEGDRTLQVVTQILGKPTETVESPECPAGPMTVTTWSNGLAINTTNQTFIGWTIRPQSQSQSQSQANDQDLTTVSGVGLGTTVGDLKAAYSVDIFESSLGTEFNVGTLSGIVSADQPDGVITNLWAGVNCIFR